MKRTIGLWRVSLYLCFLIMLTAGCTGPEANGGTFAWIDVPVDNLTIPLGQAINLEGHAADPAGVAHVDIWVNSELAWTIDDLPSSGEFVRFSHSWTPLEGGVYHILAVAHGNEDAASNPASVTVHIGASMALEVLADSPSQEATQSTPVEVTDTPESSAEVAVQYWAEPPAIEADECTTLRWQVENAHKVVLGNTEVASQGSYEVCLCESTSYRLTVTDLNGADEEFRVSIPVTGVCATPTPDVDGTPPPAPVLLKPLDGSDLGPVPDTILRWNAVSDESGIDEYQVQVQRHGGDYNWTAAPGSPWTGLSNTELPLNVEYGYTYRWRVRAVDGAGNPGSWSGWFTFSIPLT